MVSVALTAMGMASSLGASISACAAARAGLSRPSIAPYRIQPLEEDMREEVTAYACRNLPEGDAARRLHAMLARAAEDLLTTVSLDDDGTACLLNTPPIDDTDALTAELPSAFRKNVTVVQRGHAGVITLVADATKAIANGEAARCLVGAVDSHLDGASLARLDSERQLKTPINGDGFIPGEGACWLLLESRKDAEARGATLLAELGPVATGRADYAFTADEFVPTGAAWARAICQVLEENPSGAGSIGEVVHDYNGWSRRGREWSLAFMRACRLFALLREAKRATPAECFGDLGAASAGFALCTSAAAFRRGYAQGKETLVAAASQDGGRAAAILRAP